MNERNDNMPVTAPAFEWKWNLNTVVVLVGFATGFVAWGYTLAELQTGRTANAANISRIEARVERLETSTRVLDQHALRLDSVEERASSAASAMRAIEASLNALASDIRVTREIVQRIEAAQTNGGSSRN